jgi:hypothetical protein
MEAWMLGLMLVAAIAGVLLVRRLRRTPAEGFPLTEVIIPPGTREPIKEVDLLLDIPLVANDDPVRLGYVDSTVPAVQEPAPLRSTRKT